MSEVCNAYAPVKRETGGSPVRTRHCKRGAKAKIVTGKTGRRLIALIRKSGDLPFAGTEDTMGILRPRDPGGTDKRVFESDACFFLLVLLHFGSVSSDHRVSDRSKVFLMFQKTRKDFGDTFICCMPEETGKRRIL